MDPKEIVHNVRQKQAEPPQANGAPLSDRPADNSAPGTIRKLRSSRKNTMPQKWEVVFKPDIGVVGSDKE